MKKIIVLFAVAAMAAGVQAAEIALKVDGMTCEIACVGKVKQGLANVKGVDIKGTKFALGKKLSVVKVSFCDKTTTRNKIMDAIKKAGYKVAEARKKKNRKVSKLFPSRRKV